MRGVANGTIRTHSRYIAVVLSTGSVELDLLRFGLGMREEMGIFSRKGGNYVHPDCSE